MGEITNNKKNIIILFIIMIIILFFTYKGFIADSSHYLEDYKKYLLSINASKYYFNKIEKNKKYSNKPKDKDKNELNYYLFKLKKIINNNINNNEKIVHNLKNLNFTDQNKLKLIINEIIKTLNETNNNNYYIAEVIAKYLNYK